MKSALTFAASMAALLVSAPQSFAQSVDLPRPSIPRAAHAVDDENNCPHPDTLRERNWLRSGTLQPRECIIDRIAAARDRATRTTTARNAIESAERAAERVDRLQQQGPPTDPAARRQFENAIRAAADSREAALDQEQTRLTMALDSHERLVALSELLQRHYELRADRQQRFLDSAAGGTFWAGLGAGLSGRVGLATQRAWLGAAFFPLLATQQNNNEPTRDIYFAGALGMDLIDQRYEAIMRATDELSAFDYTNDSVLPHCGYIGEIVLITGNWKQSDHRSAILPEAQRMLSQCAALHSAERQTRLFINATQAMQASLTGDYADDLIELDTALLEQDRRFRNSPTETIRLMMGAPFRVLDNFLTGQNTNEALDKLKSDEAFNSLTRSLSALSAPPAPQTVEAIQPLSNAAWTRVTVTSTAGANAPRSSGTAESTTPSAPARPTAPDTPRPGVDPNNEEIAEIISYLDYFAGQLMVAQERQAHRAAWIALIREAAASNHLEFKFDTASRVVQITLGPPPPPPPATTAVGNTATGASTGASSTPSTPPATPNPGGGRAARQ